MRFRDAAEWVLLPLTRARLTTSLSVPKCCAKRNPCWLSSNIYNHHVDRKSGINYPIYLKKKNLKRNKMIIALSLIKPLCSRTRVVQDDFSSWAFWLNKLKKLWLVLQAAGMCNKWFPPSISAPKKLFEVLLKNKAWKGAEIKDMVWIT